jgi:hypothetical protein
MAEVAAAGVCTAHCHGLGVLRSAVLQGGGRDAGGFFAELLG